ncbi:serine/threonine protein kinase [Thermobrachium celere]|uniref:Threonine kinase in B12 biosynthesis n=1 Tax=Thermobrachium celere DSM 8682 TaxID=941824 RepID=R7RPI5_9CLOT|nr:serine/threonine protein kinase [Thermobrachium celere]CDF57286.1 Threonine kinase in B12 biosynthesis [Thermobrachium celere DSM 8682]
MISAVAYGSLGEVLQGNYNGVDVLCSFPVNLYTRVYLLKQDGYIDDNIKTYSFIKEISKIWKIELNYKVSIESNIPKMKGFASSTADILAAYLALIKEHRRQFDIDEFVKASINVEPTDSIIFSNATLFDYKTGNFRMSLGEYFKFYCICFEGKEGVDTLRFNREVKVPLERVDDLVPILKEAVKEKSTEKLSYVSTESIKRNQRRLSYTYLDDILKLCRCCDGYGIIGAHSGNMLSIIYDDREKRDFYLKRISSNIKFYPLETLGKDELYESINDISIK